MKLSRLATGASGLLLVFAMHGAAQAQEWQQRHSPDVLWSIATQAYNALPAHPSPAHSDVFLRALANLYAYAEIPGRREPQRAQQVSQALTWLIENLGAVTPPESKGDQASRVELIQNRGLAAYDSLRRNQAGSRFRSYVAAVTNLYVARQLADNLRPETIGALGWLGANPIRAGTSGKLDEAGGERPVLPSRAKPDAFGGQAPLPKRPRPGIQDRPDPQVRPGADDRPTEQPQSANDLSGRWRADDGGTYYIRQIGADIWWLGESADSGNSWSNIFAGSLDAASGRITGTWADVPKGSARSGGQLVLRVVQNGRLLTAVNATGGFGGKMWRRMR